MLRDLGVDGMMISERIIKKYSVMVFTAFIWLRTETSGGLL